MKHIPYLILLCICSISCQTQKSNNAILSGTIHVKGLDSLVLSNDNDVTIPVINGTFKATIPINKTKLFALQTEKVWYWLYLQKGDNLHVTIDSLTESGISFSGTGAAINTYKKAKSLFFSKSDEYRLLVNRKYYDTVSAQGHINVVNKMYNGKLALLENAGIKDKNFIALEKESLTWDRLSDKMRYHYKKENAASKDATKTYTPAPGFIPEAIVNFKADNEELYANSIGYSQIARKFTIVAASTYLYGREDRVEDNIKYLDSLYNTIDIVYLKDFISTNLGANFLLANKDPKTLKAYFDYFKSKFYDESYKKEFIDKYNKAQEKARKYESLIGTASPKFIDFENFAGGTTSLDDLKGKYVYIDVWTTMCGPCIKEFPSLEKIEKKYHDKNIVFVSISLDSKSAYDRWKKMVADKQLGGIQLFAGNAKLKFNKDYGIRTIPRFFLIDPQGNIVSADAPRPSNPELVKLFDSLDM